MIGPLLSAILLFAAVVLIFTGLWQRGRAPDPIDARLAQYGVSGEASSGASARRPVSGLLNGKGRGGISAKIAEKLSQADLPLTVVEFGLITLLVGGIGFGIGWWRGGPVFGLLGALVLSVVPFVYLTIQAGRRRKAFGNQLPDVLGLMVGALRAGYGMSQALQMLVERLPEPSSAEFARAMRAVGLGVPVTKALNDMATRVGSDDLYLVVTAMTVQQELGGNLAEILETIGDTIRGRIRLKREIQVMTSQQRVTGIILSLLPVAAVIIIGMMNPDYMSALYTTVIGRMMAGAAIFMMFIGYLVIRKIVAIEV